jgi:hypothetical protein
VQIAALGTGRVDRIRKYQTPVRVFVDGARADRQKQIGKVIRDISMRIQHLDIALTNERDDANTVITLVRDRDLQKTITSFYGPEKAKEIHDTLDPQCLSGFRKNESYEIQRSDVILTDSVPWTMFNDQVSMGFFGVYDQYIMNILYDPRIKAGMTVDEVRALLPSILPDVRAWVAKINNLPR